MSSPARSFDYNVSSDTLGSTGFLNALLKPDFKLDGYNGYLNNDNRENKNKDKEAKRRAKEEADSEGFRFFHQISSPARSFNYNVSSDTLGSTGFLNALLKPDFKLDGYNGDLDNDNRENKDKDKEAKQRAKEEADFEATKVKLAELLKGMDEQYSGVKKIVDPDADFDTVKLKLESLGFVTSGSNERERIQREEEELQRKRDEEMKKVGREEERKKQASSKLDEIALSRVQVGADESGEYEIEGVGHRLIKGYKKDIEFMQKAVDRDFLIANRDMSQIRKFKKAITKEASRVNFLYDKVIHQDRANSRERSPSRFGSEGAYESASDDDEEKDDYKDRSAHGVDYMDTELRHDCILNSIQIAEVNLNGVMNSLKSRLAGAQPLVDPNSVTLKQSTLVPSMCQMKSGTNESVVLKEVTTAPTSQIEEVATAAVAATVTFPCKPKDSNPKSSDISRDPEKQESKLSAPVQKTKPKPLKEILAGFDKQLGPDADPTPNSRVVLTRFHPPLSAAGKLQYHLQADANADVPGFSTADRLPWTKQSIARGYVQQGAMHGLVHLKEASYIPEYESAVFDAALQTQGRINKRQPIVVRGRSDEDLARKALIRDFQNDHSKYVTGRTRIEKQHPSFDRNDDKRQQTGLHENPRAAKQNDVDKESEDSRSVSPVISRAAQDVVRNAIQVGYSKTVHDNIGHIEEEFINLKDIVPNTVADRTVGVEIGTGIDASRRNIARSSALDSRFDAGAYGNESPRNSYESPRNSVRSLTSAMADYDEKYFGPMEGKAMRQIREQRSIYGDRSLRDFEKEGYVTLSKPKLESGDSRDKRDTKNPLSYDERELYLQKMEEFRSTVLRFPE